jgi:CRISPR-associated protein (TIGR03986 family)
MAKGKIKSLKNNFGFIQQNDGSKDVYFHADKVKGIAFSQLRVEMEVEFEAVQGDKGLRAKFVRLSGALTQSGRQKTRVSSTPMQATEDHSGYRFLNPYNFVRFLELPDKRDETKGSLISLGAKLLAAGLKPSFEPLPDFKLLGRCAPPPHDRYVGLSGRITCTIETITPLFVSDSEGIEGDEHKIYRFFQVKDGHAIPATSLRGMVRTVFEAVTNSCMAIFEGSRLSKHIEADDAPKLWPARITFEKGQWWLHIMNGDVPFQTSGPPQGHKSPAAWVMQYSYGTIKPSPTLKHAPNMSTSYGSRVPIVLPPGIKHGEKCWALIEPMEHPARPNKKGKMIGRFDFWNVRQIACERSLLAAPSTNERQVQGWLCITNQNIEGKHDERFFFTTIPQSPIPIPDKVRKDYKDLISDYQERHRDKVAELERKGHDPAKPLGKDAGYSRFIIPEKISEKHCELRDGDPVDLVYARLGGTNPNPTVEFIAPVSVPRVAYEKTIADLLPSHLAPCSEYEKLCPACRVFGWVYQAKDRREKIDPNKRVAYAGRVRFSHARLQGKPKTLAKEIPLAILSSPKPTTTKFYLLNGKGEADAEVDYDSPGARLHGRKFYRHHGTANPQEYRRATDDKHHGRDNQNRTVKDALDQGNEFIFTVDFENLAPVELGALLWALELEKDWVHRLGFAKPLGFGSVKIKVDKIEALDPSKRYSTLNDSKLVDVTNHREKCVNRFKTAMQERYRKDFASLDNIQDMSILLQAPPPTLPVHYPRPPFIDEPGGDITKPNPEGKQFEWFVGSKGKHYLPLATDDISGFPLTDNKGKEY